MGYRTQVADNARAQISDNVRTCRALQVTVRVVSMAVIIATLIFGKTTTIVIV